MIDGDKMKLISQFGRNMTSQFVIITNLWVTSPVIILDIHYIDLKLYRKQKINIYKEV